MIRHQFRQCRGHSIGPPGPRLRCDNCFGRTFPIRVIRMRVIRNQDAQIYLRCGHSGKGIRHRCRVAPNIGVVINRVAQRHFWSQGSPQCAALAFLQRGKPQLAAVGSIGDQARLPPRTAEPGNRAPRHVHPHMRDLQCLQKGFQIVHLRRPQPREQSRRPHMPTGQGRGMRYSGLPRMLGLANLQSHQSHAFVTRPAR